MKTEICEICKKQFPVHDMWHFPIMEKYACEKHYKKYLDIIMYGDKKEVEK